MRRITDQPLDGPEAPPGGTSATLRGRARVLSLLWSAVAVAPRPEDAVHWLHRPAAWLGGITPAAAVWCDAATLPAVLRSMYEVFMPPCDAASDASHAPR